MTQLPPDLEPADIAVIGGSGFYSFIDDATEVSIETPFGSPSDLITLGTVRGRRVAFLPRHGRTHRIPPHRINYRANLWALRAVGARQVLSPCAVGSLQSHLTPGTLVIPDQVVDRTSGRPHTVYDEIGPVVHVPFGDPYCPHGRAALLGADPAGLQIIDGGTLVVINGPRFSSRAESLWHRSAGWSVVGMTGMPEAGIARELAMCFTAACRRGRRRGVVRLPSRAGRSVPALPAAVIRSPLTASGTADPPARFSSLRGPGRQAHWRRRRLRRIGAAALAAVALVLILGRLAPEAPKTHRVLVAAHAVDAGTRLGPRDVREVDWAATPGLPETVTVDEATGSLALGPLAAGEPVLASRLTSAHDLAPGRAAVVIPVTDRALMSLVRAGDRVDAYSPSATTPVASSLEVLATVESAGDGAAQGPAVVVSVSGSAAGRLTSAISSARAQGASLEIVLRAASIAQCDASHPRFGSICSRTSANVVTSWGVPPPMHSLIQR